MATPERDLRSTPTLADLMMIELMQADVDYSRFLPNVDLNVPREVKRLHRKDSRRWLPRMIAERARLYCERVKKWQPEDIDRWLAWLAVLFSGFTILVVATVAVLHALGTTDWLFSAEENEASISGLMWLIVAPPLLCLPSLIGSVLLLFRRRTSQGGWRWINALKYFTIPGVFFLLVRAWATIRGQRQSIGERALRQFTEEKSHIVTTIFLAVSNAFMLLLSVAAFVAVVHFLLFHEVRYTWKSSLLNADTKVSVVRSIATFVPLVEPPGDAAIQWAFGSGAEPANVEDCRAEWSSFVVRSMAVLTLFPRALIGLLSLLLLRKSWRELMPDPSDPDIDKMVDNIVSRNVTTTTETVSPELVDRPAENDQPTVSPMDPGEPNEPNEPSGPSRPSRPTPSQPRERVGGPADPPVAVEPSNGDAPSTKLTLHDAASDADNLALEHRPPSHAAVSGWRLIGYGLSESDVKRLGQLPRCRQWTAVQVDGAADRRHATNAIESASDVGNVLIVVRATTVPDAAFTRFLTSVKDLMTPRDGRVVLMLTEANQHLERVEGDAERHRNRIQRWKLAAKSVLDTDADFHVLELDDAEQLLQASSPSAPSHLHFANKFPQALPLVDREIRGALERSDAALTPDQWATTSDLIREQLLQLYQDEYSQFTRSSLVEGCKQRLEGLEFEVPEGWAEKGKEAMAQGVAAYRYLGSLLSPKWLVPGAVVGIGAAGIAPFLAGGAPLLLTALPSILPSGALTGALGGAAMKHWWTPKPKPKSDDEDPNEIETKDAEVFHGLDMDAAVRSLLLLIVILELQGSPQGQIADVVERRLGDATAHTIVTVHEMSESIRQLEAALESEMERQRER